jgi:hypothetical protein
MRRGGGKESSECLFLTKPMPMLETKKDTEPTYYKFTEKRFAPLLGYYYYFERAYYSVLQPEGIYDWTSLAPRRGQESN